MATATVKIASVVWTGKAIRSGLKVSVNGQRLVEGTDYTLANPARNRRVGRASIQVIGMGPGYVGTASVTFTIRPAAIKGVSLNPGDRQVTVAWRKAPKKEAVTKYQIQYRAKGTGKWSAMRTISAAKSSATLRGLKSATAYDVRIRCYAKVNGVKHVSRWSTPKRGTTLR